MADTAFQIQYRQEFIQAFEQHPFADLHLTQPRLAGTQHHHLAAAQVRPKHFQPRQHRRRRRAFDR